MNAVDPIHIAPQKHAHPDRFSTPTSSEVVMVYALVNTLPTQGGLGLNHMNDVTPWPAYLQLGVALCCDDSLIPSDAVNFFKWFFLIFTSVQWIALVAWSLAVEKQEESGMKQMSWDSLVSKVKLRSTDVY